MCLTSTSSVGLMVMCSYLFQKSREFSEKLEISLKQSAENFHEAESRISQLKETNENLENKNHDLEAKLMELVERKQLLEEKERYQERLS